MQGKSINQISAKNKYINIDINLCLVESKYFSKSKNQGHHFQWTKK